MMESAKGNRAAMELLVLHHYDEVFAYAARRTGSRVAAQDIARTTGNNENTVKSRLRLAMEKLRDRLKGEQDEQELL